ncbi:MAG: ABC transporter substrate-binding protein [Treponema sp.]|nr:ABC transporter substrate-binding protein [Treponema sp.]
MKKISIILTILCLLLFFSCARHEEFTLEELEGFTAEGLAELLALTVERPWQEWEFQPGVVGGTWFGAMPSDPKSFNFLIAEQDNVTREVVDRMQGGLLLHYDTATNEWMPRLASPEVVIDEENGTLQVILTLRDDLYWSYYPGLDRRGNAFTRFFRNLFSRGRQDYTDGEIRTVRVTSDDVIFWYDEIQGDPAMQSSGLFGQFVIMPDGSERRITISRIDDLTFYFTFPRIVADPFLAVNMRFGPRHIFEPAKLEGGAEAVRNLHSVAVDPRTIPSMGAWFLVEYSPGQRLVYRRNPNYWRRNIYGVSVPYPEELIMRIVPSEITRLLLFQRGSIDSYALRSEDVPVLIHPRDKDYTVFTSEGLLQTSFWTFNQNPAQSDTPQYEWFTRREFRQAMSSLLNRERINNQVHRGLAEPQLRIFPPQNRFYNPDITNRFTFNQERAIALLSSIGINRDSAGTMRDWDNRPIEFDLSIRTESAALMDIATIIADELDSVGIRLNVRVIDFQMLVEQLMTTFEWQSMIMGLSGSQVFPSQGSNVWPSSGNLHMWHPNQVTPATEWEARIDWLYNEGKFTYDDELAWPIWNEFQEILLYELPKIHLLSPRIFWAINNRWDLTNVFFDNMNFEHRTSTGLDYIEHVFLRKD